ncbi:hypothetical protein [Enterococcus larvae]|uniref:hypothetical protein n=1 Tax=Enterococcus larvae TaxID=2794352 RepID=UPI003F3F4DC6
MVDGVEQINQNEVFKDRQFRYQHIYRLRRTKKQKQRFLSALVKDIAEVREDIQVIEYQQNKKYVSSNLYVGNIETADRIICTYYDTPPKGFGSYYLFDRAKQRKAVTGFILVSSMLALLAGGLLTMLYMAQSGNTFDLRSISTLFVILCYGGYFYLLSKIAKGLSARKTLIRNTSSVLAMLSLIGEGAGKKTAFAFVDEGCFGEVGLDVLQKSCKPSAKLYFLDSIGAEADLYITGDGETPIKLNETTRLEKQKRQISYIFSAKTASDDSGTQYYLDQSELNQKQLNSTNMMKIIKLFK